MSGSTAHTAVQDSEAVLDPSRLDAAAYPHIFERMVDMAPQGALIALRATCSSLRDRADRRLGHHATWHLLYDQGYCYARHTNLRLTTWPRVLDIDRLRLSFNPGRGTLPSAKLVRFLPQPLFLDNGRFFPFRALAWPMSVDGTTVAFTNAHVACDGVQWSQRPIINLLYHPACTRGRADSFLGLQECWRGLTSLFTTAYILLTPEGVPPLPETGEEVGMLTALLSSLADAGKTTELGKVRFVFVGWEEWAGDWLDRDYLHCGRDIQEECAGDMRARIAWWLSALLHTWPERATDEFAVVEFMTLAEFADEINDDELLPLILSSRVEEDERRERGSTEGRDGWGDFPYDVVDPPVLWEEKVWEVELPKLKGVLYAGYSDAASLGTPDEKGGTIPFDPCRSRQSTFTPAAWPETPTRPEPPPSGRPRLAEETATPQHLPYPPGHPAALPDMTVPAVPDIPELWGIHGWSNSLLYPPPDRTSQWDT
jgi:hypothetical protein